MNKSINPYIFPGLLFKKSRNINEEALFNKAEGILAVVSAYFSIPVETIKNKSKKANKVEAKAYFYYLCYEHLNLSYWKIHKLGILSDVHRNIQYHIEGIKAQISVNRETRLKLEDIKKYLN